jgi:hypothetical protein
MKTQRIPFLILNLICATSLFSGLTAQADSCKIAGISNPPQTISCKMRDMWYRRIEGRIECVNGQYFFSRYTMDGFQMDTNHVLNAYHKDRGSRQSSALVFPIDEFGDSLVLIPGHGNRFKGSFDGYNENTGILPYHRCKAI